MDSMPCLSREGLSGGVRQATAWAGHSVGVSAALSRCFGMEFLLVPRLFHPSSHQQVFGTLSSAVLLGQFLPPLSADSESKLGGAEADTKGRLPRSQAPQAECPSPHVACRSRVKAPGDTEHSWELCCYGKARHISNIRGSSINVIF